MRAGSVGSHLHMIEAWQGRISITEGLMQYLSSWIRQIVFLQPPTLLPPCIDALSHDATFEFVHVKGLRSCIQSGIYRVDSITLARCIIVNETHFYKCIGNDASKFVSFIHLRDCPFAS
jgi:hypothetical protein